MRFVLAVLLLAACQNTHRHEAPPAVRRTIPLSQVRPSQLPVVDDHGLPPSCAHYIAYVEQLTACPQIPADARKTIRDALEQALPAWRQAAAQNAPYLEDACASGTRALVQSVQSIGC